MVADAYHVTGIDADSPSLDYLLTATLKQAGLVPGDVGYINAHGTGTQPNDIAETRGIRSALGAAADSTLVSSTKSMLGHLVNAAGSVELAITALALRDGFAPPTVNLTIPTQTAIWTAFRSLAGSVNSSTRSRFRSPLAAQWLPSLCVAGPRL